MIIYYNVSNIIFNIYYHFNHLSLLQQKILGYLMNLIMITNVVTSRLLVVESDMNIKYCIHISNSTRRYLIV